MTAAPTPEQPVRPALAGLVGDPQAFLSQHWETSHLLTSAPDRAATFAQLLSADDLRGLIAEYGLRAPFFRLVRDGGPLPRGDYLRSSGVGQGPVHDLPNVGRIAQEVRDGASVVGQALQRVWPPLTRFCQDLSQELGHPVQANAYLSPARSAGFDLHYDTHDVFILQVDGEKQWAVHGPEDVLPVRTKGLAAADRRFGPLVWEGTLTPGDCLYLPRGFGHLARAGDDPSLHLTIGVLSYTWRNVLRRLAETLPQEDPVFRQAIPVGVLDADDPAAAEQFAVAWEGFVQHLASAVGALDPEEVRAALQRSLWANQAQPDLAADLADAFAPSARSALAPEDEVAVRAGVVRRHASGPDGELLVLADREVRLPPAAAGLMALLLDGAVVSGRGGAAGLDEGSTMVVLERLRREGVVGAPGVGTAG